MEKALGQILAMMDRRLSSKEHFESSIQIRDDDLHRVLYAVQLEEWDGCDDAEPHAEPALQHPLHEKPGFNTHAEAHQAPVFCAWSGEQTDLGNEHMREAHRLARETGWSFAAPGGAADG